MFSSFWAAYLGCKVLWFQHNYIKDERTVLQSQTACQWMRVRSELNGEMKLRNADVVAAKARGWMAGSPWGADNDLGWTGLMFTCLNETPPRYHSKPPAASSAFLTAIFSGSRPGKKKKWAIIWSAQSGPQITGRHILSASARRLFTGGMEQLISEGTTAPSYITINKILQLLRVELPFSHLEVYRLRLTTKNIKTCWLWNGFKL